VSDFLKERLRQEEEKLRGIRQRLAALAERKAKQAPIERLDLERVRAVFSDLGNASRRSPEKVRTTLLGVVESIVLTRKEDGRYRAEITLKNEATANEGAGGRVLDKVGCGGRIWSKAVLLAFAPNYGLSEAHPRRAPPARRQRGTQEPPRS
jgi:hypothetical protein